MFELPRMPGHVLGRAVQRRMAGVLLVVAGVASAACRIPSRWSVGKRFPALQAEPVKCGSSVKLPTFCDTLVVGSEPSCQAALCRGYSPPEAAGPVPRERSGRRLAPQGWAKVLGLDRRPLVFIS